MRKKRKVNAIITQNIDGFHQLAGSRNVYELHGTIHRNFCTKRNKFFSLNNILKFKQQGIPKCNNDGIIKPDVILYNEQLDQSTIINSIEAIKNCDILIVTGTSLSV